MGVPLDPFHGFQGWQSAELSEIETDRNRQKSLAAPSKPVFLGRRGAAAR